MIAFAIALNLLPALYLGWDLTIRAHERTYAFLQRTSALEDIAENGMEVPKLNNQSLIATFARYIQSYPPGHPMCFEHPAFFQYGNLDKATAKKVAQWTAVCIFAALISPVCWRHHLVLAWPSLFLFFRGLLNNPNASRWVKIVFAVSLLILWLPQSWLHGPISTVILAAKPDTFVFLSLAFILLVYPRCIQREATQSLPAPQQLVAHSRAA
jgi:hypothetical protein